MNQPLRKVAGSENHILTLSSRAPHLRTSSLPTRRRGITPCVRCEMKATGIRWNFGPCFAVARDIRWGRTYESYGENPEIAEMFAEPSVNGYQGEIINGTSVIATAKHYVADGGTTWGTGLNSRIDHGNAEIDTETLRTIHLPAYVEAIDAGVGSIMVSFSSVNGTKMHEYKYLITDVL